jgi:NADH:ubiquinone oxidoreductase subunit C
MVDICSIKIFKGYSDLIPIIASRLFVCEFILVLENKNLTFAMRVLKQHTNFLFRVLSCVSGVDMLDLKYRFCIAYELLSLKKTARLRLKSFLTEVAPATSITSVFVCANWWEREIWDLFGIYFISHNDMRRILTDYGFEGHPLRKDFPLCGYIEHCYSDIKGAIVAAPIQLSQEYRNFSFENWWGLS